jgi:hypothetical protein
MYVSLTSVKRNTVHCTGWQIGGVAVERQVDKHATVDDGKGAHPPSAFPFKENV